MNKNEIISKVKDFLIEEFELEEDQVTPDALLKDDLDIGSLDFVDIAVIIDKEFGVKMQAEEMIKIKTLDHLYSYILERI
ncbi:MAG: phosphopantetheine-binding protein [Bacteroidales bacterium]|nr:phosphopantetheine-binding protein [Bacteroidales bacterium]